MLRADFFSASGSMTSSAAAGAQAVTEARNASGQSGFSGLMRQLNGEIRDYIERGSTDSNDFPLNAEARAWLARQQSVTTTGESVSGLDMRAAGPLSEAQKRFVENLTPWASEAAQRLGVAPDIIAAQAALETGWGTRPLRQADGSDSHNLFSIKAGPGWKGETTEVLTTEFEGGIAVKRRERFRSYADKGEAFRDFARLIAENPRYQSALNSGRDARAYAEALSRGGYATDPAYVDKLVRISAQVQGD